MLKKGNKEIIFFMLLFVLFILALSLNKYWSAYFSPNVSLIFTGLLYVSLAVGIYFLAGLDKSKENFWDVSQFAQCKGGPYMWQGDSENSKICRELAETPAGRCGIASYNCPTGYNGVPSLPFLYTPLSDDNWQNERCEDKATCGCKDAPASTGLCSMVATV